MTSRRARKWLILIVEDRSGKPANHKHRIDDGFADVIRRPGSTRFVERFVKAYDPRRRGNGPIGVHLVMTADPRQAQRFATRDKAATACRMERGAPTHYGERDRPLMARYTLQIVRYDDACTTRLT